MGKYSGIEERHNFARASYLFLASLPTTVVEFQEIHLSCLECGLLSHVTGTYLLRFAQGQRLRSPIQLFYQQSSSFILGRRLYPQVHFSLLLMRTCYVCRQHSSKSKLEPAALYHLNA